MRIRAAFVVVSLSALCLTGCPKSEPADEGAGTEASAPETSADPRVVRAAEVSAALEAAPGREGTVLARYELTMEDFEALMLEIAADPALSTQFRELRQAD